MNSELTCFSESAQRKILGILKDKDEEITRLRNENEEIKGMEEDIERKLKQTEMLLEAHEIANRQRSDNQEIERLENVISKQKKHIDMDENEITQLNQKLHEQNILIDKENEKFREFLSEKNSRIKTILEEMGKEQYAKSKSQLENKELKEQNHILKNELRMMREKYEKSMGKRKEVMERERSQKIQLENSDLRERMKSMKKKNGEMKEKNDRLEMELANNMKKMKNLEKKNSLKEEELKKCKLDMKMKFKEYEEEIKRCTKCNEEVSFELEKTQDILQEKTQRLNHLNRLFSQAKDKSIVLLNTKYLNCLNYQYNLKSQLREKDQSIRMFQIRNKVLQNETHMKSKRGFEIEAKLESLNNQVKHYKREIEEYKEKINEFEKKEEKSQQEVIQRTRLYNEVLEENSDLLSQIQVQKELNQKKQEMLIRNNSIAMKKIQKNVAKKFGSSKNTVHVKELTNQLRMAINKLDKKKSTKLNNWSKLFRIFEEKYLLVYQNWQKQMFQKSRVQWELDKVLSNYVHLKNSCEIALKEKECLEKKLVSQRRNIESKLKEDRTSKTKCKSEIRKKNRELFMSGKKKDGRIQKLLGELERLSSEKKVASNQFLSIKKEVEIAEKQNISNFERIREMVEKGREKMKNELEQFWITELRKLKYSDTEKVESLANQVFALKIVEEDLREKDLLDTGLIQSLKSQIDIMKDLNEKLTEKINDNSLGFSVYSSTEISNIRMKKLEKDLDVVKNLLKEEENKVQELEKEIAKTRNFEKKIDRSKRKSENHERGKSKILSSSVEELRHVEKENQDLISALAKSKLKLDDVQSLLGEKDVEIKLLKNQNRKRRKRKNIQDEEENSLSYSLKNQKLIHQKLVKSLNTEIELRNSILEKESRIKELRSVIESFSNSTKKKRKNMPKIVELKSSKTIELESEVNFLKKKLIEERVKNENQVSMKLNDQVSSLKNDKINVQNLEKLNVKLKENKSLMGKLQKEKVNTSLQKKEMVEKVEVLEDKYEKICDSYGRQKELIGKLKLKITEESTKNVEKQKMIKELKEHRKNLTVQIDNYRSVFEEGKKNTMIKMEEKTSSLVQTMGSLRKEQENIQKLMNVITDLRKRNDSLLQIKKRNFELEQKYEVVEEKYRFMQKSKNEFSKKLTDAKKYIKTLRDERIQIQSEKNKNILQLKEEFEKYRKMQGKLSKEHLLIIENLEAENQRMKKESLEFDHKISGEKEKMKNEIDKLNGQIIVKEKDIMKKSLDEQKENRRLYEEERLKLERMLEEKRTEIERITSQKREIKAELKDFQEEFKSFRDQQHVILKEYKRNTKDLSEKLLSFTKREKGFFHSNRENEKLKNEKREMESRLLKLSRETKNLQDRVKELIKKSKDSSRKNREERLRLKAVIEKLKQASHTEEEWKVISTALESAKRALKNTQSENHRKGEIISSMKKEFNTEIQKLETSMTEHKKFSEQFREAVKDKSRRSKILKDYKSKLEEMKKKLKSSNSKLQTFKGKCKELGNEQNRKDQFVKSLQNIIEKKNQFIEDLKVELDKNNAQVEKKDSRIKLVQSRLEKVHKSEKLKISEFESVVGDLKKCVLNVGDAQMKIISKLEKKMLEEDGDSHHISSKNILLEESEDGNEDESNSEDEEDEIEDEDEIISVNSSLVTNEVIDSSNLSIVSHKDIGLSLDEMQDIMQSTQEYKRKSSIFPLKRKKKVEKKINVNSRTQKAMNIIYLLKKNMNTLNSYDNGQKNLEEVINLRVKLEKIWAIMDKNNFFSHNSTPQQKGRRGGDWNINSDNNLRRGEKRSLGKVQLKKENFKLKHDVEKMKQKEIIYENTVKALEKQLLQDN